ncbi:MAG: hypothetical protein J6C93_04230 [Clostridia bacterium]|nr:hypothetical protein [Clostridia bacterium]
MSDRPNGGCFASRRTADGYANSTVEKADGNANLTVEKGDLIPKISN